MSAVINGQILCITSGECSMQDYEVIGHVRALRDFETIEIERQFRCERSIGAPTTSYLWLIRNGWVEPVEIEDWYIG